MLRYLVNARNQAESTKQSRFLLHTLSFAWLVPHAHVTFSSEPSHNLLCATILDIISTSYAYVLSLRREVSPQPHDVRDRSSRSLIILTAHKPMGLSSRCRLIFLALRQTVLTREHKISSSIAREIEILSIFAGLVPTLVPKHNSMFQVFLSTICWLWWSTDIYETFGWKKLQFPCGMLFLLLAHKQVRIWGRHISSILGFRSPNFAQRNTLVYWNRIINT